MKVKDIVEALEQFAPLPLQEDYDNAGMQLGLSEAEVSGALLCLDVTETVMEEAFRKGMNMVISHHPLLFRPLKHIGDQSQAERIARYAIKHDIIVYSAHTNLDNVWGGVNFEMARRIELKNVDFLQTCDGKSGSGVVGYLPKPQDALNFLKNIKETFGVECLCHNKLMDRPIEKVALCGGAGDFLLLEALKVGADAFLTGEMHYHVYFGYENQIQIGVMGHYQSEHFTQNLLKDVLVKEFSGLRVELTDVNTNPIYYL